MNIEVQVINRSDAPAHAPGLIICDVSAVPAVLITHIFCPPMALAPRPGLYFQKWVSRAQRLRQRHGFSRTFETGFSVALRPHRNHQRLKPAAVLLYVPTETVRLMRGLHTAPQL